jgi:putative transcriptional regulator
MAEKKRFLRGQLLLDGGNLSGSFFHRTVVLICQHDAEGAFGLVLSRPSGGKVGDVLVADLPEHLREQPIFLGGPVQTNALSYLLTDEYLPESLVLPNLTFGHSLDDLLEAASGFSPTRRIKLFAGYAGWSPGQLDDEIHRDAWVVCPASIDLVFDPSPELLWKSILRSMGWKYRLLAELPDDLTSN